MLTTMGMQAFGAVCGWAAASRYFAISRGPVTRAGERHLILVPLWMPIFAMPWVYGGIVGAATTLVGVLTGVLLRLFFQDWLLGRYNGAKKHGGGRP
jgi:hypothetical protein